MPAGIAAEARLFPEAVNGLKPRDFRRAYGLPSLRRGAGEIVAIVDAFDNPNVASDLATYRSHFRLGNATFVKYNQNGEERNYPQRCPEAQNDWCLETDLDVEMIAAVCPKCTIYLIEADNNSTINLFAAEREAVTLGAHIVSDSWGGGGGSASGGAFDAAGVTYVASAGDDGYGMQDPADYQTVVSVGGTILTKSGTTYKEVVWPQTGGGCSFVPKPSWQQDPLCGKRTGNDVAAVAENVAEYDSYKAPGWIVAHGTSISAPLVAGVYALAGNAESRQSGKHFWTMSAKKRRDDLHKINRGSVVDCPERLKHTYLCAAGTHQFATYSGPAGWGTPNGLGAF